MLLNKKKRVYRKRRGSRDTGHGPLIRSETLNLVEQITDSLTRKDTCFSRTVEDREEICLESYREPGLTYGLTSFERSTEVP